jgi:hypothetical protein
MHHLALKMAQKGGAMPGSVFMLDCYTPCPSNAPRGKAWRDGSHSIPIASRIGGRQSRYVLYYSSYLQRNQDAGQNRQSNDPGIEWAAADLAEGAGAAAFPTMAANPYLTAPSPSWAVHARYSSKVQSQISHFRNGSSALSFGAGPTAVQCEVVCLVTEDEGGE